MEGTVRQRWLHALPRGAVLTEPVRDVAADLTLESVMQVADNFPSKKLSLSGNNCCDFVSYLEEEICVGDECDAP